MSSVCRTRSPNSKLGLRRETSDPDPPAQGAILWRGVAKGGIREGAFGRIIAPYGAGLCPDRRGRRRIIERLSGPGLRAALSGSARPLCGTEEGALSVSGRSGKPHGPPDAV